LFPALFCEVVVVVHPGLPLHVLVLPPWVEVDVVTNPVLFPAARAAPEVSANEIADANASVEISFVMGNLFQQGFDDRVRPQLLSAI
jgi:hypothetical protein